MRRLRILLLGVFLVLPRLASAETVTVFAAASLTDAITAIATTFEEATGHRVRLSFAGSSALARQIERGAPADVFISASPDWMDHLEAAGAVQPDTRFDLAMNRLVLIANTARAPAFEITPETDLPTLLQGGRLAMALTEAVPAGVYGRMALTELGLWDRVADQVAETDNVRTALMLVATGAAPLGVVYITDALQEPRVHILARFPAEAHAPITYPAALVAGVDSAAAQALLAYLRGPEAIAILSDQGFAPAGAP